MTDETTTSIKEIISTVRDANHSGISSEDPALKAAFDAIASKSNELNDKNTDYQNAFDDLLCGVFGVCEKNAEWNRERLIAFVVDNNVPITKTNRGNFFIGIFDVISPDLPPARRTELARVCNRAYNDGNPIPVTELRKKLADPKERKSLYSGISDDDDPDPGDNNEIVSRGFEEIRTFKTIYAVPGDALGDLPDLITLQARWNSGAKTYDIFDIIVDTLVGSNTIAESYAQPSNMPWPDFLKILMSLSLVKDDKNMPRVISIFGDSHMTVLLMHGGPKTPCLTYIAPPIPNWPDGKWINLLRGRYDASGDKKAEFYDCAIEVRSILRDYPTGFNFQVEVIEADETKATPHYEFVFQKGKRESRLKLMSGVFWPEHVVVPSRTLSSPPIFDGELSGYTVEQLLSYLDNANKEATNSHTNPDNTIKQTRRTCVVRFEESSLETPDMFRMKAEILLDGRSIGHKTFKLRRHIAPSAVSTPAQHTDGGSVNVFERQLSSALGAIKRITGRSSCRIVATPDEVRLISGTGNSRTEVTIYREGSDPIETKAKNMEKLSDIQPTEWQDLLANDV